MAVTTQARPESRSTTTRKWVYLFEEGNKDMRDLLGGKGAGVAEMTRAGLPVPPGFTITTEACNAYYASDRKFPEGMWEQAIDALHHVEKKTGKKLGDPTNPLLVSVRSRARIHPCPTRTKVRTDPRHRGSFNPRTRRGNAGLRSQLPILRAKPPGRKILSHRKDRTGDSGQPENWKP